MVSRLRSEKVDIHNYTRRMERALKHLKKHQGISECNKQKLHDSVERVDRVAHMLDQLLEYLQSQEDSDSLRLLIVVEEAYLRPAVALEQHVMQQSFLEPTPDAKTHQTPPGPPQFPCTMPHAAS